MNELVFVLNTTRDDFSDWFCEKANWNPDPDMKQKIKKSAAAWGTERRLSKIYAKQKDIQSRDKTSLRLLFGDESHYPGAELYFRLLPVDDKRLEVTASFSSGNGLEIFREALQIIAQTYHESADVITAYLWGARPVDAASPESKKDNDIPKQTKRQEKKIRETSSLNLYEWEKAEIMGVTPRQWLNYKKQLGLSKPHKSEIKAK